MLTVKAGALLEALPETARARKTKKHKAAYVSFVFDARRDALTVSDARHGAVEMSLRAEGEWDGSAQIDAALLARFLATHAPQVDVTLTLAADQISIAAGQSRMQVPRLDAGGSGGIALRPVGPDKRHKGKVEVPPDPVAKRRAEHDSWGLSAHVPMPPLLKQEEADD